MKSLLCKTYPGLDGLSIENRELPNIRGSEVLVEVEYCGINFPDILICEGRYQFKPELPFSPGAEIYGKVLDVGEDCKRIKKGDYVAGGIGWGGMAEKVICLSQYLSVLDRVEQPWLIAGSMVAYGTAYHALIDRAKLKKDETIAILGASGGVGSAAIDIAQSLGARVIAISLSEEKQAYCQSLGAHYALSYDNLKERLKSISQNGIDVVVDMVGGQTSEQALRSLSWKGRFLTVGYASGLIPEIPLNLTLLKGIDIKGVFWSRFKNEENDAYLNNQDTIISSILNKTYSPRITKIVSLKDAIHSLKQMKNRNITGKHVIKINHP